MDVKQQQENREKYLENCCPICGDLACKTHEGKTLIGICGDCEVEERCFIITVLRNHPGWKEPLGFGCSVWQEKEKE